MYQIDATKTYLMGIVRKNSPIEDAEWTNSPRTVYGTDLIDKGITTLKEWCERNPDQCRTDRQYTFYEHEVTDEGEVKLTYVGQDRFQMPQPEPMHLDYGDEEEEEDESVVTLSDDTTTAIDNHPVARQQDYPRQPPHTMYPPQQSNATIDALRTGYEERIKGMQVVIDSQQRTIDQLNRRTSELEQDRAKDREVYYTELAKEREQHQITVSDLRSENKDLQNKVERLQWEKKREDEMLEQFDKEIDKVRKQASEEHQPTLGDNLSSLTSVIPMIPTIIQAIQAMKPQQPAQPSASAPPTQADSTPPPVQNVPQPEPTWTEAEISDSPLGADVPMQ